MRIILKILGLIGAVIVGVFIVAGLQTPDFRIERTRKLSAPPEAIYSLIGTMAKWRDWSPWLEMEPGAEVSYSGPEAGAGATQTWKGQKIGSGSITLLEAEAPSRVKYQVQFIDWNATNFGEFRLVAFTKPDGSVDGTQVTWVMEGKNNLIARVFWLLMGVRKNIEKDFDRGLDLLEAKSKA